MTAAHPPSLWLDPAPVPGPPLEGDLELDFLVIGGGYTGLSAALALAEAGAEVAVVERDYAGFGASGRNAGHLTPTIGKDLPTLLRLYGRERGGALVRLAEEAIEHVESTIADRAIACDYERVGNLLGGIHPAQAQALERAAQAGRELGASLVTLSSAELTERGLPAAFCCGYMEQRGGILDPGKYVRGLRESALASGVQVYEGTRVSAIEPGPRVRVETARGRVSAGSAIVATNAYTPELGVLGAIVAPIAVSLFATEPLTPGQLEAVEWPGREGVYTAHEILESYRLTADNRIVGGSRHIRYAPRGRIPVDEDAGVFASLEAMFRARFPELRETAIDRCWSGPVALTLDFLPAIGRKRGHPNLLYSVGYAGHGVAMASYAGTRLAGMALGTDPGPRELTERRRIPLPPEPLRTLGVKGLIKAFEAVDRRTDRRAQPRR